MRDGGSAAEEQGVSATTLCLHNPIDEAALKDIVVFEPSIYDKAGGWSESTTALLADGARLRAWRDRALAAYRSRFDPVALLRRADAWNERPRGDL